MSDYEVVTAPNPIYHPLRTPGPSVELPSFQPGTISAATQTVVTAGASGGDDPDKGKNNNNNNSPSSDVGTKIQEVVAKVIISLGLPRW